MELKRLFSLAATIPLAATGALIASEAAVSAATFVVVSQDGQHGWHSRVTNDLGNPDPSFGSVTFVTGPATPPRGIGSLRLQTAPGKGNGSAQMRNTNYAGVPLTSLSELTYYAYSAMNNGQQFPYLTLNINNTGGSTLDDTLFFEPPYQEPLTGNPSCPNQGPTVMVMWQKWDALHGCWWDNNGELGGGGFLGVQPLSVYTTNHPGATIINPNNLGGLRVAVGFASPTDTFDGNVDLVTVGVNGRGTTSYDFEPPQCQEADGNGDFHGDHGDGNFSHDNDKCKDGDEDRVDSNNRGDGKDFHSTQIDSAEIDNVTHTITITGTGLSAGVPVSFVLLAVESDLITPGWVSFTFSDGYTNAGTLLNGSVLLH